MRYLLGLYILFFLPHTSICQDILYLIDGTKMQVKVIEVEQNDIKYSSFESNDGSSYYVSRNLVVLILYQNGTSQIINPYPPSVDPQWYEFFSKSKNIKSKDFDTYYANPNMISINALALANGDLTILYDRDFLNNRFTFTGLMGYNFNSRMGLLNLIISDSKDFAKKKLDSGFGISYNFTTTKRVQGSIGLQSKYMTFDYKEMIDTTNNSKNYRDEKGYQLSFMITNGWLFRVSSNFNFKIFTSVGVPVHSFALKPIYNGYPKFYLGYCFGYRF
jgi:hypothetical protein